jgi:diaminopimelate epimerase
VVEWLIKKKEQTMTVKELIEKLKKFDENTVVEFATETGSTEVEFVTLETSRTGYKCVLID